MNDRKALLADLRGKIADIERKPLLAEETSPASVTDGRFEMASGVLTEMFADRPADVGAATGFAFALAATQAAGKALMHIQLASDDQELGLPYGPGLPAAGISAEAMVLIRPDNIADALWAVEEASGCSSVGAVLLETARHHKELDFKAARRLALRAADRGVSVFLTRFGRNREASPSGIRWHVAAAGSLPRPFDDRAPGDPVWRVTLEKGKVEGMLPGTSALAVRTREGIEMRPVGSGGGQEGQTAAKRYRSGLLKAG